MACRKLVSFTARPWVRRLSSYREKLAEEEAHAASIKQTWKMISLFVCGPTVGYFTWKNLIAGGHEGHTYTYVPWSHLRIRTKPFPWGDGDASLFHNPRTNPRPDGEPEHVTTGPNLTQKVGSLWIEYLHEDTVKRDEARWRHLEKMQRRKEQHLARKRAEDVPIRPMDLVAEVKVHKPNPAHSGIDH